MSEDSVRLLRAWQGQERSVSEYPRRFKSAHPRDGMLHLPGPAGASGRVDDLSLVVHDATPRLGRLGKGLLQPCNLRRCSLCGRPRGREFLKPFLQLLAQGSELLVLGPGVTPELDRRDPRSALKVDHLLCQLSIVFAQTHARRREEEVRCGGLWSER